MFYAEGQGWIKCFSFCPFDNEDKSVYIKLIFVCASLSIIVCMFCFVFPSSDILDVF